MDEDKYLQPLDDRFAHMGGAQLARDQLKFLAGGETIPNEILYIESLQDILSLFNKSLEDRFSDNILKALNFLLNEFFERRFEPNNLDQQTFESIQSLIYNYFLINSLDGISTPKYNFLINLLIKSINYSSSTDGLISQLDKKLDSTETSKYECVLLRSILRHVKKKSSCVEPEVYQLDFEFIQLEASLIEFKKKNRVPNATNSAFSLNLLDILTKLLNPYEIYGIEFEKKFSSDSIYTIELGVLDTSYHINNAHNIGTFDFGVIIDNYLHICQFGLQLLTGKLRKTSKNMDLYIEMSFPRIIGDKLSKNLANHSQFKFEHRLTNLPNVENVEYILMSANVPDLIEFIEKRFLYLYGHEVSESI